MIIPISIRKRTIIDYVLYEHRPHIYQNLILITFTMIWVKNLTNLDRMLPD